jgi:hypothetical protein
MLDFPKISFATILICSTCLLVSGQVLPEKLATNSTFNPETYICYHTSETINVDGKMDETDWQKAPWTNLFVDIEGDKQPKPLFPAKAKMLWDKEYFYVVAEITEPHIWANLTKRDAVIFYDNDFEVFIDPDWDTHNYYEFEMNALNTVWDLMLQRPYRDGAYPNDSWDITGLKSAVHIDGTINDPSDEDNKWWVEIAMPINVLREANVGQRIPKDGDQWRLGFSRVNWQVEVKDGKYVKKKTPEGKKIPEYNWVWSPVGVISMHMPEAWGVVQFSKSTTNKQNAKYKQDVDWEIITQLRNLYYRQKNYRKEFSKYAKSASELRFDNFSPKISVHGSSYIASVKSTTGKFHWFIREDGKLWKGKM